MITAAPRGHREEWLHARASALGFGAGVFFANPTWLRLTVAAVLWGRWFYCWRRTLPDT